MNAVVEDWGTLEATAWAWEQPLPPAEKLVLLAYADKIREEAIPKRCGLSRAAVSFATRALVEAGLLDKHGPCFRGRTR